MEESATNTRNFNNAAYEEYLTIPYEPKSTYKKPIGKFVSKKDRENMDAYFSQPPTDIDPVPVVEEEEPEMVPVFETTHQVEAKKPKC